MEAKYNKINQYLTSIPLNNSLTLYNGKKIKTIESMGKCSKNSIILIKNLEEYDDSSFHVICFVDVDTQIMLEFIDKCDDGRSIQHHVFLYNRYGVVDPLLGYHFQSFDNYLWVISQFLDIPANTNRIGAIFHKLDNITEARCKPELGEMIRLDIKYFNMINAGNLNNAKTRTID